MSTEAIGAATPEAAIAMDTDNPPGLHSPPDSNNAMNLDASDSELSDLEELADKLNGNISFSDPAPPVVEVEGEPEVEEDIGEILPDHFSGTVPVFRPNMKQFKDFKRFMEKIDHYGMKSGIVKIVPPDEWRESLPELSELVKQVRVREPIKQDIMGSNGTYRQVNILHQRSYNMPQWRQLCDQSEHQPPARRGERRANAEKHKPSTRSRTTAASGGAKPQASAPTKKRRGRLTRGAAKAAQVKEDAADPEERPMTPVSPPPEQDKVADSIEDPGVKEEDECDDEDDMPVVRRMGGIMRQSKPKVQSTSARRKYIRREGSAMIDEAAFRDWDYRMDVSDYTPERCEELERIYWKTLTYAPPLYGADLPGTLFDESTEIWNLNKLPNLLDVLGTKVPGVNTAYLYLGMWKATFAWHLEDVDLYSINYLHFGAPKQWYSISQADARRFEAAMKNIWPNEAKACDQFLRHKAFLISPAHLKQHYNITVNKCVSYPGEFVVTYPYGYHSGYNLGYNCAEAVNFALDSWLPMGKIAKKCQCAEAQDSVWVDVYEIERKLRGESTEYEETEDEEDEDDDIDEETGLPSPPSSHTVRVKAGGRKRKRTEKEPKRKTKKVRLRLKAHVEPPCCLCPNDIPGAEIMSTDDGRKAHRMCALYLPETFIETVDDVEIIANVGGIDKARLELKCLYCRSKKGACFQCSQKKCPRSYHATCAAAAGVFVEEAEVPVIGEDGTEYKEQAFEFSCRFHRTKRDRKFDGDALENNPQIREAAKALKKNDICQMQYFRGEIFAGVVVENRHDEETLLLDIIPNGDHVEVEWKWLLLPDPADLRLPKASANAIPMPTSRKAKQALNAKRPVDELPRKDDEFAPGFVWAEFHTNDTVKNPVQTKIDFAKDNQIWHYLGKTSTEAKAQYTESLSKPVHNLRSNFLDSIPKPVSTVPIPLPPHARRSHAANHAPKASIPAAFPGALPDVSKQPKPYVYKPRKPVGGTFGVPYTSQTFAPTFSTPPSILPQPQYQQSSHRPPLPPPVPQQQLPRPQQQHQKPLPTSQFKHYQPPGKGDQGKKKPTIQPFSKDRFAPIGGSNGFPQLPGLSWPPAHMNSGHYSQPHSRVWSSSTDVATPRPYPTPMTSSSLKSSDLGHPQGGVAGSSPQVSAYQKYSFFQVHHNRDECRYRTPYGHWGGFTNGYEGNLQQFLIKARHALAGRKDPIKGLPVPISQKSQAQANVSPAPDGLQSSSYASPYGQAISHAKARHSHSPSPYGSFGTEGAQSPSAAFQDYLHAPSTPGSSTAGGSLWDLTQTGSTLLHPAIRPQYGGWSQQPRENQPAQHIWSANTSYPSQAHSSAQASGSATKASSFHKQSHSPIPLPPYVKKASTPASSNAPKPSPLSRPPQKAVSPAASSRSSPVTRYPPQHAASGPSTDTPSAIQQAPVMKATTPRAEYHSASQHNNTGQLSTHHHQGDQWQTWLSSGANTGASYPTPTPVTHAAAPMQQHASSYPAATSGSPIHQQPQHMQQPPPMHQVHQVQQQQHQYRVPSPQMHYQPQHQHQHREPSPHVQYQPQNLPQPYPQMQYHEQQPPQPPYHTQYHEQQPMQLQANDGAPSTPNYNYYDLSAAPPLDIDPQLQVKAEPAAAESPEALVEKMMMNLKRASGQFGASTAPAP
ncbi:hypothetical protein B0H66DRAFT_314861 [Apodospora peruviana]|uniref:[histone H3]-trimethyl-L-lysine(9) demethylase n=1 Tax=Apodospora peruviana TaxID=516989 RepID=A0AAE0HXU0_9PEZI|nr:hypothetical protein B0H66DRAFT_314861 [Apodospora peruviana]